MYVYIYIYKNRIQGKLNQWSGNTALKQVKVPARYSVYLLYLYQSTNTDAEGAAQKNAARHSAPT
jgi:hypothetical protein